MRVTPYVQSQYNHNHMNTVSIQCLAVDRRSLTYLVVLQNPNAPWLASTRRRSNSSLLSARAYATQSAHRLGHHCIADERCTVGREPSSTDHISARATTREWDSPSYSPYPQLHLFLRIPLLLLSQQRRRLHLLPPKWPGTSNPSNPPTWQLRSLMQTGA